METYEFYQFDIDGYTFTRKKNTLEMKSQIGMIACNQFIYSVGGEIPFGYIDTNNIQAPHKSIKDPSRFSNECEKYDIRANKWMSLPRLKEQRRDCKMFAYKCSWIFAAYGVSSWSDEKFRNYYINLRTVEKIKLPKANNWEIFEPQTDDYLWNSCNFLQYRSNKILVFGDNNLNTAVVSITQDGNITWNLAKDLNIMLRYKEKPHLIFNGFATMDYQTYNDTICMINNNLEMHSFNVKKMAWEY